jgi:membrane associated rhomboid family serine protease
MIAGMIPEKVAVFPVDPNVTLLGAFLPFLSSMFLHGGFMHLIGNMWFLWIFGDNIEDHLGHLRYLGFYLICGLGAGLTHLVFNWGSNIPTIGASGAVAGVLGGYFLLYPRHKVLTLIPFIFIVMVELPAAVILIYWFVVQFFSGAASIGATQGGGVAWWAHVGGFVLGVVLILLFGRRQSPPQVQYRMVN